MPPIWDRSRKDRSDGSSAGGYLAVMAAVFDSGDKRTRPECCGGNGSPNGSDFPAYPKFNSFELVKIHGWVLHEVPQNYLKQSPLNHLSPDDPPVAIICGELDKPSTRANAFRQKALQLGVPTSLTEISGAPHGLLKATEHRRIAINALDEFFRVHLLR